MMLQKQGRSRSREIYVQNDALKAFVEKNPTVSIRELTTRMEVDNTKILWHLSEIYKEKQKMVKWIPHPLRK